MKTNKFIVRLFNDDKTLKSEKEYKSFRDIQAELEEEKMELEAGKNPYNTDSSKV
jgi:hypothetical protein